MVERNNNKQKEESNRPVRIAIAGGGTGGHLFPAIAIAQEFMEKNHENKVIFVSTGNPLELSVLEKAGFKLEKITAEGIKGRGLFRQIRSMWKIPKGIFESMIVIKKFKPDLVMGVGSYSAGPVAMGAWFMRKKIVLHEQNILPGITNRILSRLADRIYVSFKKTKANFDSKKVIYTGNPVRKAILQSSRNQKESNSIESVQDRPFTVLIVGGSQGAHSINEAVVDAMEFIKEKDRFYFIHQTGKQDEISVNKAYKDQGISCNVKSFFDDMANQYLNADLVICRAGATTVAELAVIGKGVIFIPFPFATDNHQVLNARTFADTGAAEMILEKNLNGRVLAERIEYYMSNRNDLELMATRSKNLGRPDAAQVIVDDCYKLIMDN